MQPRTKSIVRRHASFRFRIIVLGAQYNKVGVGTEPAAFRSFLGEIVYEILPPKYSLYLQGRQYGEEARA